MTDLAIDIAGLTFWYEEGAPVLRDVALQVPRGQLLALVGANGSGKTTLVKHLNGLLRPRRGKVQVAELDVAQHSVGQMARHVGFLFQHPEQQILSPTVWREVAFGPRNIGLDAAEVQARVERALARFKLEPLASHPPAILGYGARRRVTLASLAAMDPEILVLDEPTVGLDAAGQQEMVEWMTEVHTQGRTVVLVTHDMALVAAQAERAVVLVEGQIAADGPPARLFQDPDVLARASLNPPPVTSLARTLAAYGLRGDCLTVECFCDEYEAVARNRHEPGV